MNTVGAIVSTSDGLITLCNDLPHPVSSGTGFFLSFFCTGNGLLHNLFADHARNDGSVSTVRLTTRHAGEHNAPRSVRFVPGADLANILPCRSNMSRSPGAYRYLFSHRIRQN